MLKIPATEFKMNMDHYLEIIPYEDILITKNGKVIAKVVNPNAKSVDSISGILKGKITEATDCHSLREGRSSRN
jgi:antitoxin (DNA-binding transcriptional repressor) of toxin-antitoxin stability system